MLRPRSVGCAARATTRAFTAGVYDSALHALGNTPVIRLRHMAPSGVDVFVKCEAFNPMLSTKDRLAAGLIDWAHSHKGLASGQTVVDVVQGSSGFGLALACRERGNPLVAVVAADNSQREWRRFMRFMGAKVLVSDAPESTASRVAERHGWFFAPRHRREANEWIHAERTGPEILRAMGSRPISHFIAPHGTGGMLRGVGRLLRDESPATRIVVVEQDHRPHPEYEATVGPHHSWPNELLRGWTTDFEPTPIDVTLREQYVDEVVTISGHESMLVAHDLARKEGLFTGISGGALAAGALRVARQAPAGSCVLTVLLDTSLFTLDTPLIQGVSAEMSAEEARLVAEGRAPTTPTAQFTDG